jgi:NosR/NirI family transcriptional regulator, nitrous oxide reductase regulator
VSLMCRAYPFRVIVIALALWGTFATAAERFPSPDFESGYVLPTTPTPIPRAAFAEALDVGLLLVALALATYFALKMRSRKALTALMLFCLAYFGFWKKGCICPVGSWQNVFQAATDNSLAVAPSVLLAFALPIAFALLFGRVFCSSVCPLGAIQDVVVLRPKRIPAWLQHALGLMPYVYLGVAALLIYTDSAFLVCRYDPFVGIFRMSGSFWMLLTGASLLLLGIFIARPYCRFLCPYGVLLSWAAALSWRKITVTPTDCIQCRLCETACPFDCIDFPSTPQESRRTSIKRLAGFLLLIPLLIGLGIGMGPHLAQPLTRLDRRIQLITQLDREAQSPAVEMTEQSEAFRASGVAMATLRDDVKRLRKRFRKGGRFLGGFFGLVLGWKLALLAKTRKRTDYEPNRTSCLACGRCFAFCPQKPPRTRAAPHGASPRPSTEAGPHGACLEPPTEAGPHGACPEPSTEAGPHGACPRGTRDSDAK